MSSTVSNAVIVIKRGTSLNKYIPGFEKFGELAEAHAVWGVIERKKEREISSLYFVTQIETDCWGNYPD